MGSLFALLLFAAAPAANPGPWIVKCDMGLAADPAKSAAQSRTFRIGAGLLQEWRSQDDRFGPNLCNSFPCRRTPERLEGVIASASVMFTIALDPPSGRATWRAQGASGLKQNAGDCVAAPDKRPRGAEEPPI